MGREVIIQNYSPALKDQTIAYLSEHQLKCIKCEGHMDFAWGNSDTARIRLLVP